MLTQAVQKNKLQYLSDQAESATQNTVLYAVKPSKIKA